MRPVVLVPTAELRAHLEESGVEGLPMEGPDDETLQGLYAFALHFVDREKRLDFTDFTWDDPVLRVLDGRVQVDVTYARLEDSTAGAVSDALRAVYEKLRGPMTVVAFDARRSGLSEYQLIHHLYGEVTLFAWPTRPRESQDPRIEQAREAGWSRVLKERNLVPGRGIVVPDEKHGLFLTDPWMEQVVGALVLLPSHEITFELNPFAQADRNDSELQHWLGWGQGVAASEWIDMLHIDKPQGD